MTFTKERIEQFINNPIEHGLTRGEQMEMARQLLAGMEQEPVGEVVLGEYDESGCHPDARVVCIAADGQADWENFRDGTRLYAAPPAPVSVPDAVELDDDFDSAFEHGKAVGWNNYRAAMLQGAEPVSQRYTLSDGFDFDRFNDVVWLEAVASNPHMHSPTTSTIAMVALELNRKLAAGNSPAIPDGWVLVPVEPTQAMIDAHIEGVQSGGMQKGYRAMLAAAPQQEADNG